MKQYICMFGHDGGYYKLNLREIIRVSLPAYNIASICLWSTIRDDFSLPLIILFKK